MGFAFFGALTLVGALFVLPKNIYFKEKKMKKFNFLCLLCLVVIIGAMVFTSCASNAIVNNSDTVYNETDANEKVDTDSNKNNSSDTNADGTKETSKNENGENNPDNTENGGIQQSNKVNLDIGFTSVNNYSNGLLFATARQTYNLYCIDKQGNINYILEGKNDKYYKDSYHYNGEYVFLLEYSYDSNRAYRKPVLCDDTGKLVFPSDIGANYFYAITTDYRDYNNNFDYMFTQGYIFAIKQTSNFSGTKNELAILNAKLEKIIDFSEAAYSLFYNEFGGCYGSYYRDGYFQVDSKYYDLNTLTEYTEDEVLNRIVVENESDFWKWKNNKAYDLKGDIKVDLSQYDTIAHITDFQNGMAGVLFKTDVLYFSIVDEKGTLLFEPVKTDIISTPGYGTPYVSYDNGNYVVYGVNSKEYSFYSFDVNGLIATMHLDTEAFTYAQLSDGVIVIRESSMISLYNMKLEPLF